MSVAANCLCAVLTSARTTFCSEEFKIKVSASIPTGAAADEASGMVQTETTRANLGAVLEAADNPIPMLIEGSTGVGKSATVIAAAKLLGVELVRFNMSSRVTIDDLLGKVQLADDNKSFVFVAQHFTKAFEGGFWLLLDELNLATDVVLQSIESAIDTRELVLRDPSSAQASMRSIAMHSSFRLFATQNPNSGFFKGKREALSASFLNRFQPLVFKSLPKAEWVIVVTKRLGAGLSKEKFETMRITEIATRITDFHVAVQTEMCGDASKEKKPYAEVSIRELLKVVDHLRWYIANGCWPASASELTAIIVFEAWGVYGARFRALGRDAVLRQIEAQWHTRPLMDVEDGPGKWAVSEREVKLGSVHNVHVAEFSEGSAAVKERALKTLVYGAMHAAPQLNLQASDQTKAVQLHLLLRRNLANSAVAQAGNGVGLYDVSESWLYGCIRMAAQAAAAAVALRGGTLPPSALREIWIASTVVSYALRIREAALRTTVVSTIKSTLAAPGTPEALLQEAYSLASRPGMSVPMTVPFVATGRFLRAWMQIARALRIQQPVLLTGETGCGKSECLKSYASLCGHDMLSAFLTPESEPADLIGSMCPNTTGIGARVKWRDAAVTIAFRSGGWICLDNLNESDACVLERLNPVLEQPAMLVLTENSEHTPLKLDPSFRVLGTMSPPSGASASDSARSELSPALYNRFCVIHMEDITKEEAGFKLEVRDMARALLGVSAADAAIAADLCWEIFKLSPVLKAKLTFRSIVRVLDCAFRIHAAQARLRKPVTMMVALLAAAETVVFSQVPVDSSIENVARSAKLVEVRASILSRLRLTDSTLPLAALQGGLASTPDHILTPSRLKIAEVVCSAITCGFPVLLEGPAAVGKTALVSALRHLMGATGALERVNNTETTTIQVRALLLLRAECDLLGLPCC